jgi:3-oxoacyl-[acyl-carrier-protein] synthase II
MQSKDRRIVVTGLGPLSAIGTGKTDFWNGIIERKTSVVLEENPLGDEYSENYYIHKMKNFNIKNFGIDNFALEDIKTWKNGSQSIDLEYLLAVIKLALDDSKLQLDEGHDTGIILAHEHPGLESFFSEIIDQSYQILKDRPYLTKKDYFKCLYSFTSRSAYDLQTFMFLYHVAKAFNIHGFSLFINNACSSGLYAIETAAQIIKSAKNDVMIVAAVDKPSIYINQWLKIAGLYADDGIIKPFAKKRNGFICGQGGAALVLEELEYAKKRNAHIYSEYIGGGFSLESWKVTLPNVGQSFYKNVMIQSFKEGNINADQVDLINAHGVATNVMDQYEAEAIRAVFGEEISQPIVSAFKPYIGHNLGGCALLETALLLLVMENSIVPSVLNCEEVDPKLRINVPRENIETEICTALKLCSSFAGFDAAALFRKI